MIISKMTPKQKATYVGKEFKSDERETSILFDHKDDVVHLETTDSFTAKRWLSIIDEPGVKYDERADSFKIVVPKEYCRNPELVLKAKHRQSSLKRKTKNKRTP